MTTLFRGGEDTSFTTAGTVTFTAASNANQVRSSFARAAFFLLGSTADPPANRIISPTFTASFSFWLHGRLGTQATGNGTTANATLLRLLDGGVARLLVRGTGTAGQYKISTRNAAGTITDLVTSSAGQAANLASSTVGVDLFVNYAVAGQVTLYIDGVSIVTFSGDVTTNAATTLNQFDLGAASTANNHFWSEMIVADTDSRAMALWTLAPQAAGNTQSWTPNTVGNINEVVINDATSVTSTTANALSQWTTPTATPSGSWAVRDISQEARVAVGVSGLQHFDWDVRTGGANFDAGTSQAPTTAFTNFYQTWTTNPNTGNPWLITDIAAGFNLGIKALT